MTAKGEANGDHGSALSTYSFDCRTGIDQTTWNDEKFTAGDASQSIWFAPYNGKADNWTIFYPAIAGLRVAKILFIVDSSVATPTFKALGEYPYTEYNFEVRGKCIGQPDFDGHCD